MKNWTLTSQEDTRHAAFWLRLGFVAFYFAALLMASGTHPEWGDGLILVNLVVFMLVAGNPVDLCGAAFVGGILCVAFGPSVRRDIGQGHPVIMAAMAIGILIGATAGFWVMRYAARHLQARSRRSA